MYTVKLLPWLLLQKLQRQVMTGRSRSQPGPTTGARPSPPGDRTRPPLERINTARVWVRPYVYDDVPRTPKPREPRSKAGRWRGCHVALVKCWMLTWLPRGPSQMLCADVSDTWPWSKAGCWRGCHVATLFIWRARAGGDFVFLLSVFFFVFYFVFFFAFCALWSLRIPPN
jgi:hypothetical protein